MDKDIEQEVDQYNDPASEGPQEILDKAKPGDIVRITLRGPASGEEINELVDMYNKDYPGVSFIIVTDGLISKVEIVGSNG